ncbi:MAG: DUF721 domain-containing protein [Bryobacterales bacterium]|nr:DUF721 domain-containing protein [Bryobacterales bacterium]
MEQAKRILARLLQQDQAALLGELDLIRAYWLETVGPLLAEKSNPVTLDPPRLLVEVLEPAWMTQFVPMKDQILLCLRQELPRTCVREIKFVVRDLEGQSNPRTSRPRPGPPIGTKRMP